MKTLLQRLLYQWKIKLNLLLLAILLWFFVVNQQVYETEMQVPLVLAKMKPNKILVSDVPVTAQVKFSGPGKDLLILRYIQHPRVELDIHTINYFYDYPVRTDQVVLPPGMNVTPLAVIEPETVKVILEDEYLERLPVVPRIEVTPQAGYMVPGRVTLDPESVLVVGPRSLMRRLRKVETEERVFVGLNKSRDEMVPVARSSKRLRTEPEQVRVHIPIDRIGERKISRVPVQISRVPRSRRAIIEPSTVTVRVRGAAGRLAGLTADSLLVGLSYRDWKPDQREYAPFITLPPGVELVDLSPSLVRVRVEVLEPR
ncbi:MAG TPA: YbbR-like domain-containing protein [Bacteroidetes bacterium]|nr:YbbR-like domain-containing protein [Bacteroidota bacterium]